MMNRRCLIGLIAFAILVFLPFHASVYGQERRSEGSSIWEGKTFTRFTYEEDIKDTLTAISKLSGIPFTFGDGITDTVTMEFKKMPLKDAFDFLIHQFDMEYTQDAHAIHIFKPGAGGLQDLIISLQNLDVKEAKSALARLGLVKKETKIVYDTPTNSIFVTGPARDLKNIRDFINLLEQSRKDVGYARPEIRYYALRYAKVSDIQLTIANQTVTVRGLTSVLTDILGLTRAGEAVSSKIGLPDRRGGKYSRPDRTEAYNEFRRQAGQRIKVQQPIPTQEAIATQQDVGARLLKTMITSEAGTIADDARTNRIIIRDYPEKLDEYGKIIRQLDKPMKMVKIDVIIVQASNDFGREFGMGRTFRYNTGGNSSFDYGTSAPSREVIHELDSGSVAEKTLVPLLGAAAGSPTAGYGLAGTFLYQGSKLLLANTLQATETKGISKTINKSSVITMDNMQSIIETKQTVTYKIQSGGLDPVVDSEEIDAGLKLTVTPHIIERPNEEDMVEMTVAAERSFFLVTRTDGIPEKASTSLTTQAVIGDDATLVVGGNFEQDYASGATGTPCLMDVPVVGYVFKLASTRDDKTNILFFISPTIISLDAIPYEGPELKETVEREENELKEIDSNKPKELIEKHRDLFKEYK